MPFSATMSVEELNQKHPDYESREKLWKRLSILYEGATAIEDNAGDLLDRRPKEPEPYYELRRKYISYTNILEQVVGWYRAAMFKMPPQVQATAVAGGAPVEVTNDRLQTFLDDCDRRGTRFVDFWPSVSDDLMIYGRAFVLIDKPFVPPGTIQTRAQERQQRADVPYLVRFPPEAVTRWQVDQYGNLDWVYIYTLDLRAGVDFPHTPQWVDKWYYFNRTEFAVYERVRNKDNEEKNAVLVADGQHAMAQLGCVPLLLVEVPPALWLGKRAYLLAKAHLNKENQLDWLLLMAAIAMLVVVGEYEESATISEIAWMNLPAGGDAKYLEPSGVAFDALGARCQTIQENIFRQMYLLQQARETNSLPSAQSGISKEMDMVPSYEVCAGIGKVLKGQMDIALYYVAELLGLTDVVLSTHGFEFENTDPATTLDGVERVLSLGIPSDTLQEEAELKAASVILGPDADPLKWATIEEEIRDRDERERRKQEEQEAQLERFSASISKTVPKSVPKKQGVSNGK